MLDTHNRTVSFETLVLLKTLKIHNQYPQDRVPKSIRLPMSFGIIKANYSSITVSLIDHKLQWRILDNECNSGLRVHVEVH